jgi:hypothetical protein
MSPHAFASGPPSIRRRRARPTPALLGTAFASVVAIAVPGALAGSGCSLAIDGVASGCQSNDDCRAKGESFAGSTCREGACRPARNPSADGADWSCLTSPPGRGVVPPGEVRVGFRFVDLESAKPIEGASFLICGPTDTTCARPLRPAVVADADGAAETRVSTATSVGLPGFGGYFQVQAPDHEMALYSFYPPLLEDVEQVVVLGRPGQIREAAPSLGFVFDPERAAVVLLAHDCRGRPAADVIFELEEPDPMARLFYGVNAIPTPGAAQTDRGGVAFVFNAPLGVASFRMSHVERGTLARFVVLTRRDYSSTAVVRPSP